MIRRRTALFVGIFSAFLLVWIAAMVAIRLIDTEALRTRLAADGSQRLGGEVSVGSVRISLLPLPHMVLDDVHIAIPAVAEARITSAAAYPRWMPLLRGDVQLRTLRLFEPTAHITLPHHPDSAAAGVDTHPFADLPQHALAALAAAATAAPGLTVTVKHATLVLAAVDVPDLQLTDLNGQLALTPRRGSLDLTGASTLVDHFSVSTTFDPEGSAGNARLVVTRLRPHLMPPRFQPRTDIQLVDSEVGGELRVTTTGAGRIDAVADLALPRLVLERKAERLSLTEAHVEVELQRDGRAMHVTLRELRLASPRLRLSGSLELNDAAGTAGFQVDARQIDVETVRPAVQLLGGSVGTRIVDVLRGGAVSDFAIAAHGAALADLGAGHALEVYGHLTHGRVHIPGIDLDLHDVSGDASVAGGVLSGTHVAAAMGRSQAHDGTLRLGLEGRHAPLRIDAAGARLVLDDVYPQLKAAGWLQQPPWNPDALRGVLALESVHLSGAADTPSGWRFELAGAAQNLEIESPLLSERIALRSPVSVSGLHLARDPAADTVLSGDFSAPGEVSGSVDVRWNAAEIALNRLQIHDHQSQASLSLQHTAERLDFGFKGHLEKSTVDALIPDNHLLRGSMRGDLQAQIKYDHPAQSILHGSIQADEVTLPIGGGSTLRAQHLSLDGRGRDVRVDANIETEGGDLMELRGTVQAATEAFVVDLDVTAGRLEWDHLAPLFGQQSATDAAPGRPLPLQGSIEVAAESFTFHEFTWKPVRAGIKLGTGGTTVAVTDASLCGIATPGTISLKPQELQLAFEPVAQHQRLESMLGCLGLEGGAATGEYALSGHITASGPAAELGKSLQGHVVLEATNGRLHRLGTVAKILSAVSVATGSIANIRDLGKEDLPYDRLKLKTDVQGATLLLRSGVIDGPTAKMVAKGRIDVSARSVDLAVLVAPLRTVDTVVSHVPIVGTVLGGSLISIPVKVSGPWNDPDVVPLAPSAVGTELTSFMKRTLKLPFKVIQPVLSGAKK